MYRAGNLNFRIPSIAAEGKLAGPVHHSGSLARSRGGRNVAHKNGRLCDSELAINHPVAFGT